MRGRGSAWRCRWGGFWGCVRGEVVVCTVGGGARRMYHGAANTEALLTKSHDQKVQDYSEPFSPELAAQGRESAQCCGKDGCGVQVARTRAAPASPRVIPRHRADPVRSRDLSGEKGSPVAVRSKRRMDGAPSLRRLFSGRPAVFPGGDIMKAVRGVVLSAFPGCGAGGVEGTGARGRS